VTGSSSLSPARRLSLPAAVDRRHVAWLYASTVGLCHLIALLSVLPWFVSWSGLALALGGLYVFGGLGINLGYHRLLTHRGWSAEMAGIQLRRSWRLLYAGHARALGGSASASWYADDRTIHIVRWLVSFGAMSAGCWWKMRPCAAGDLRSVRKTFT
jgi:fatty-acid desaturase